GDGQPARPGRARGLGALGAAILEGDAARGGGASPGVSRTGAPPDLRRPGRSPAPPCARINSRGNSRGRSGDDGVRASGGVFQRRRRGGRGLPVRRSEERRVGKQVRFTRREYALSSTSDAEQRGDTSRTRDE